MYILPYAWAAVWGVLGHGISLFTSMSSPRNIIQLKYGVYLCILYIQRSCVELGCLGVVCANLIINLIWRCV